MSKYNRKMANIKQILQLFVPPIYYKVKKRLFPKKEHLHHPLTKIEHHKQRMVIIGTGPSLNKTIEIYEQQLLEADCMMVNFSASTPLFERLRPAYYIMMDPGWIMEGLPEDKSIHACIDAIVTKTQWPMTLVLPSSFQTWWAINEFRKNSKITLLFDESDWSPLPDDKLFPAFDSNQVCPPTYTTLTYGIYLSLYWDYAETYLVGADTSFLKDMYVGQKDNVLYTIDSHYYDNQEVCYEDIEPEKHGRPFRRTMEQKLYELYMIFYEYNLLNRYAKWKGLKLYNASEFSMIDCLERKKLA